MAERIVRHKTTYGTTPYPVPLILRAQDESGSWRYWSTGKTVKDDQEALNVAAKLLPKSCKVSNPARTFTGRPGEVVRLVTVGLDEGSDADNLAEILNADFTDYKP